MSYSESSLSNLSNLVKSNDCALSIIDWLRQRNRNPRNGETTVDYLQRELTVSFGNSQICAALNSIAEAGFGTYRPEHPQKGPYILWKGSANQIPQELDSYVESLQEESTETSEKNLNLESKMPDFEFHDFPVRPGVKLPIQIRADMSDAEIKRMGEFLINIVAPSHSPSI